MYKKNLKKNGGKRQLQNFSQVTIEQRQFLLFIILII